MHLRPSSCFRSFAKIVVPAAAFAATISATLPAAAQRMTRPGDRGHLVLDQISGFRANYDGGFTFYGLLGFAVQSYTLGTPALTGSNRFEGTRTTNTFFISPTADYFLFDHFSIGGHFEAAFVSGKDEIRINPTLTQTYTRPSTTDITILPRIGYMFAISDRFGIWPRGGVGYTSRQVAQGSGNGATTERFGSAMVAFDVGFLYRFTEAFFVRMAPELTFSLGGTRSWSSNGLTYSTDASLFQFSALAGVGVMIDLL